MVASRPTKPPSLMPAHPRDSGGMSSLVSAGRLPAQSPGPWVCRPGPPAGPLALAGSRAPPAAEAAACKQHESVRPGQAPQSRAWPDIRFLRRKVGTLQGGRSGCQAARASGGTAASWPLLVTLCGPPQSPDATETLLLQTHPNCAALHVGRGGDVWAHAEGGAEGVGLIPFDGRVLQDIAAVVE